MHIYAKCDKIYHEVQELLLFSLHVLANRHSHSDYSADTMAVQ